MKIYWTALFTLFTFFGFAQTPTGDIEKDTALANSYYEKAVILEARNDTTNQIIELLKEANELYEAHPFYKKLIEIKGRLAFQYLKKSKTDEAELLANTALDLAKTNLPNIKEHNVLSYSYYVLSVIFKTRNMTYSIEYAKKGMKSADKNSKIYYRQASILMGNYADVGNTSALDSLVILLENGLTTNKTETLSPFWLYVHYGKMLSYHNTYNYEKALLYSQKLLQENEKHQLISLDELSSIYIIIGYIYSDLMEYEKALKWIQKGMETSNIQKDTPSYGFFYSDIGWIYQEKKEYRKAIEYFEKAITSALKDSLNMAEKISIIYGNITANYLSLKEYSKAEIYNKKSREYGVRPFQDYHLGEILTAQGKYEEGVQAYHNVLLQFCKHFKSKDVFQSPSEYETFFNKHYVKLLFDKKGQAMFDWGKSEKDISKMKAGLALTERAIKIKEEQWENAKGFDKSQYNISHSLILYLSTKTINYYDLLQISDSDEIFEELFTTLEKRKAIQLIETLSPSLLPKPVFMKEQVILKRIKQIGQQLDLAKIEQNKDSITHYQNTLFEENQVLEKHMEYVKVNFPKEAQYFYHNKYATIKEIQQVLPENTLMIIYNLSQAYDFNYSHIMTVGTSNKNITKAKKIPLLKDIEKLNKLIQSRLSSQKGIRDKFIDASHSLYKTLIAPIESELEGKTKLMIVVEGQLFHLPFELLLASNEKKPYHELNFLIKKYEINYHYSATAFLKLKEKETVQDNSLLAFAPIFNKGDELTTASRSLDFMVDSVYRSIEDFEFTALPNTKKEVNAISKLVKSNNGQTNVLLSKNATKDKLAQQIEQQPYQFVHIATHGLVNFKNPRLSALACYSKDETMENLMYANEIQFKDINADLVILSSCESGIGQLVQGEGLIALNRSFIYSGAKNVIFSLWKVSDKYSSELMIDFYKNYFDNTEKPSYTSALRQAKLKMLEDPISAQPKFWSAFVLMGE